MRLKNIVSEMAVHIPLCVADDPKKVLLLGDTIDKSTIAELKKHSVKIAVISRLEAAFDLDENISWRCGSAAALIDEIGSDFDAIIDLRTTKPNYDEAKTLLAKLTIGGILLKAFGVLEREHLRAYSVCRFVIPCAIGAFAPLDGTIAGFVFASKKLHPTADLRLQRADMVENLGFYTSETHIGAFALPPFLLSQFDEMIKS